MSIARDNSAAGSTSRRTFLQGMGAAGVAALGRRVWSAPLPAAVQQALRRAGKSVTLLEDGGFQGSAWGWQFTEGAALSRVGRHAPCGSVQVRTQSGDYARFLVLGPETGKTYTLSGWVKTEGIVADDDVSGAYFTASQFEFQGRPTEYTVDGKQIPEKRYGNFTGTAGWQRFSQSFTCLPGTTWFEVAVGIARAAGKAWFSELTFVEGSAPADLDAVVDYWQALAWAHRDRVGTVARSRPAAAVLRDTLPVRGHSSDPQHLAQLLSESYDVSFLTAPELADPQRLNRAAFDLLVLPYGESFPLPARAAVEKFLADGGDLFSTGGYAFQSPLIQQEGRWQFYEEVVHDERGENLLPALAAGSAWTASEPQGASFETAAIPGSGQQPAARVSLPSGSWNRTAAWFLEIPGGAEGDRYCLEAWVRTDGVHPAPDGQAFLGIEQLDEKGESIEAAGVQLAEIRDTRPWQQVRRLICLAPGCRKLRVGFGLQKATGTLWVAALRLEHRLPQVRINTASGFPQDELQINPRQIGMFDADFRLKRASLLRPAADQKILHAPGTMTGAFQGYAATCVLGMNRARWIPLLECFDGSGRKRGAAGSLVHHLRGPYAGGSWAFFGVDNQDLFAPGSSLGEATVRAVAQALTRKCFLHACETDFACYRQGEPVRLRVLATNLSAPSAQLEVRWTITAADRTVYQSQSRLSLAAGQTERIEAEWRPASFAAAQYRVTAELLTTGAVTDNLHTGFVVWSEDTLRQGLPFEFRDNYFQAAGQSLFLQGTDDYLHTFIDQDENPLTWQRDVQGCRDSCIDVYENLMGLRGPQNRPTQTWWRWVDAMLLATQAAGGVFFPGMLIFSNTAVSNRDLAEQQAFVRAFADHYRNAAGIMYYLNGDLELHDPNLPDIQALYTHYLREKYGTDDALREAWALSPPEAPIGRLSIHSGKDDWRDIRTLDDFKFRTEVVRRWLNTLYDSIRTVDRQHPVTAEFYSVPVDGIDLPNALGKLELANFGYFAPPDEDFYRFPQVCKFLDQRIRGKGLNIGEFGVKTHPAWRDASDYIAARSEAYEHAYFLAIAHYGFALGASKIQNWCWKYPSDLPFEWGINYSNELVPRDVRAVYRNTGLFFRRLRPRYEPSDTLLLIPGDNRKGGQAMQVLEGLGNSLRLLIDARVSFSTLGDEFLDELPPHVRTIFYPLPYCPDDRIVARLEAFVRQGGQLYISGDLSYDPLRRRTRADRLTSLCGVEFVSERYPNIDYQNGALPLTGVEAGWPDYIGAPGIVMRLAGARTLVAGRHGAPVVTEFSLGQGRVIFSADPIELHGDPRYQPYAHAFYRALCAAFHLSGEAVEPAAAPVHVFRVPSQDEREITILVNTSTTETLRELQVPSRAGEVGLTLGPLLSGAVIAGQDDRLHAVESSGDVRVKGSLLLGSDLHCMAVSISDQPLDSSRAWLFLPMAEGLLTIAGADRWRQPVVLVGEIADGRWRQGERFSPSRDGSSLALPITPDRALSMVILCEADHQSRAVAQIETWVKRPWEAEGWSESQQFSTTRPWKGRQSAAGQS
ncbi:MAG TPA: hypothetical protein VHU89_15835 [Acidobacteriaceae bacterium]|jgi:hypothetical protein|nr:hypothetical protein [Acidobacteriaceae bacterium]